MAKRIREPADPSAGPVAAFGFELRNLRQQADLSYTAIAAVSFFSKSAVHAVDQGHTLPSATILEAFVTACGEDPRLWLDRRAELVVDLALSREEAQKPSLRDQGLPAPAPATVSTPAEFNDGLKRLREWSGLTYRQIEENSAAGVRVAPSTLCGAFTRGTLPRRNLVASFLQAIRLPEDDQQAWLATWKAIKEGHPVPHGKPAVLPTAQDLLGSSPADAIASNPRAERPRARLTLQSSPPPENIELALIPQRIPDGDYVIPTYLPTSEIRDWKFYEDGGWKAVDDESRRAAYRRRQAVLSARLMLIEFNEWIHTTTGGIIVVAVFLLILAGAITALAW